MLRRARHPVMRVGCRLLPRLIVEARADPVAAGRLAATAADALHASASRHGKYDSSREFEQWVDLAAQGGPGTLQEVCSSEVKPIEPPVPARPSRAIQSMDVRSTAADPFRRHRRGNVALDHGFQDAGIFI